MSNYREIASVKNSQICAMPICCRLLVLDKRKNSAKRHELSRESIDFPIHLLCKCQIKAKDFPICFVKAMKLLN